MCRNTSTEGGTVTETISDRLPETFKPNEYALSLTLKESTSEFFGVVEITGEALADTEEVSLHAESMNIRSVSVLDPNNTEYKVGMEHIGPILKITGLSLSKGDRLYIKIEYDASLSNGLSGFYKSADRTEKETKYIYSTQFEAPHARTALPCWDEPEYKARFHVTITAPKKYVILSNAGEKDVLDVKRTPENEEMLDKDVEYKKVLFKPTPLMSTYLLAWVIGDLKAVESGNIRVFSPRGLERHGEFGLKVAKACLGFFNEYFDFEYQMDKLDMVAIPDFSAGAMENWGLVTYRSSSLHYIEGSTTERQKMWIAETICHELAHQWFGNLVTMKWWNDLWLNEGFATWAGTLATAHLAKEIGLKYDVWEGFLENDISRGLAMDGKESTHPINMKVASSGDISSIFDAISYSKGGSMIHMLANYIKYDNFKKGLQRYIKRHQYKNTVTSDLWKAVSTDESDESIPQSMDRWINTPGFPVIHVSLSEDKQSVVLEQERYLPHGTSMKDDTLWNVFLTKKGFRADGTVESASLLFKEKTMSISASELPFVLNEDASGFYYVKYSPEMLDTHVKGLLKDTKSLNKLDRYGIFRDIVRFVIDNHETVQNALELLPYISESESASTVQIMAGLLQMIASRFEEDGAIKQAVEKKQIELLQKYESTITDYSQINNEDVERQQLEILAVGALAVVPGTQTYEKAMKVLEGEVSISEIHFEYRLKFYMAIAKFGGEKGYSFLYDLISSSPDESEKLRAITAIAFSSASMKDAFELFSTETPLIRNQDKMRMVHGLSAYKNRLEALRMFFKAFDGLVETFSRTKDHVASFVQAFLSAQYDREAIAEAETFFADEKHLEDAWVPSVKKGLEIAKLSAAFCEKNADFLKQWAQEQQ
ncbi:hypothetical protein NECID01_0077 [Nematocida sp. AWRm77]|nr:hypothetical protein NECID01_0077 [Nematocida sp. AWRm77]